MLRIFHVPSHLAYVAKLVAAEFAPVPSPLGRALRLGELAALDSWAFFDVLHVHTVELATIEEIERVASRATREGKRLVFTAHDLIPNIETDGAAFDHKTTLIAGHAAAVVTLTGTAAQHLTRRLNMEASPVHVVPHGTALPLQFVGGSGDGEGIGAFGALRPNRDFVGLVRAWLMLPPPRPALRVLVRSLRERDRRRYATLLAELDAVRRFEPELTITTTMEMLTPSELVSWCQRSKILVLPYRWITHSGQLELARDLGLRVLAPEVPTLHAQLADGPHCQTGWFPARTLDEPERFAGYLRHALSLPPPPSESQTLRAYRAAEHRRILDAHHNVYFHPEKV